jgi:hypothetical protein
MDMEALKEFLVCGGHLLALLRNAKDLMPKGPQREDAERAIAEAERALRISEASAARALDYQICRCSWPPQIALSIGPGGPYGERFRCPACKRVMPEDIPLPPPNTGIF